MRKEKTIIQYDPDIYTEEVVHDILGMPDMSTVAVPGLSRDAGAALRPVEFKFSQENRAMMMGMIRNLFDSAAGTPQPVRSNSPETATEASIIDRRNTAREDARGMLFKKFQINTAKKFWQLHQQFQPERGYRIDPRVGLWQEVNEDIAKGEYRFSIDVSSRAVAKSVERKALMDMYNLLVGSVQTFMMLKVPPPNIVKALELVLVRGFDITDPESLLPAMADQQYRDTVEGITNDPMQRQEAMQGMQSGGGAMGANGPGPINPQAFAASPASGARQMSEASRLAG
jgi:hypothetical protein